MTTSTPSAYQCAHVPQLNGTQPYPDPIALQSLENSAASGCLLCTILLAVVKPLIVEPSISSSTTVHVMGAQRAGLRLSVEWRTPENIKKISSQVELFCDEDIGQPLIPKSQPTSTNTADESAFHRLTEWSKTCIESHHLLCTTMSSNNNLLPRRILSLSRSSLNSTPEIFLKEPTTEEKGHYACLSHSWGGHQPLKTLTASLEAHKKSIPWGDLPKTFQDAVAITLRLNLQYIWIDSLCIIQDSEEDWSVQSALMADIYRNATITLSAAASKGPNDGLFFPIPSQNHAVKLAPAFVTPPQHIPNFYTRHSINHDRGQQPLLSRGWVHQERLLSPRVIHFGTYELIWECMQASDCECGASPGRLSWFNEKRDFHPTALAAFPPPFTAFAWRKIVQDFCGLELSFPSDAFPAVSGAAKIVRQNLAERGVGAKYIAGLWECWFVEDCLWSVANPVKRPDVWRAPTFSWASVLATRAGRLMYRSTQLFESAWKKDESGIDAKTMTVYAILVSCERELDGQDDTGKICSASAILTGPLMKAKLVGGEIKIGAEKISGWPDFHPDYDFSVSGHYQVLPDASLWCLQLASLRIPLHDPRHEYLWFLVLRRIGIGPDAVVVYERVGLLRYRENFDIGRPVENWFHIDNIVQNAVVKLV